MSLEEIVFRFYKEGDEEGIVKTMVESFGNFRRFGLTAEDWLEFDSRDPGFRKDLALIAEYKGETVSHVQLVLREKIWP